MWLQKQLRARLRLSSFIYFFYNTFVVTVLNLSLKMWVRRLISLSTIRQGIQIKKTRKTHIDGDGVDIT